MPRNHRNLSPVKWKMRELNQIDNILLGGLLDLVDNETYIPD